MHYAFDLWADRWRNLLKETGEAKGDVIIVRYADDIVVGFEYEADARRFLDEMRARLGKFALSVHPDKTRLIEFGRFAAADRARRGLGKPETFDFLGFTHICGKSRKGFFQLQRKTRADRMRAKLKGVKEGLRRHLHRTIPDQGRWLGRLIAGYYNYFAVPTNGRALGAFRGRIVDIWRSALQRRSQKDRTTWDEVERLARDYLPMPRILHPWPDVRFAVKHPRWEPYAGKPHVRICAGGAQ